MPTESGQPGSGDPRAGAQRGDEALFAAAAAGELGAWEGLTARLGAWLTGSVRASWPPWLSGPQGADDVAQLVWLVAWQRRESFRDRGPGTLRSWLRRIAANKLSDARRGVAAAKRDVRRERGGSSRVAAAGRSPSSVVSGREASAWLRWATSWLTDVQRRVIELVEAQRLSHAEAGAQLSPPLSDEAARKHHARGLHALTALALAFDLLDARSQSVLRRAEVQYFERGESEARARLDLLERVRLGARQLRVKPTEFFRRWQRASATLRASWKRLLRLSALELELTRCAQVNRLGAAVCARRLALPLERVEALLARIGRRLSESAASPRRRAGQAP